MVTSLSFELDLFDGVSGAENDIIGAIFGRAGSGCGDVRFSPLRTIMPANFRNDKLLELRGRVVTSTVLAGKSTALDVLVCRASASRFR